MIIASALQYCLQPWPRPLLSILTVSSLYGWRIHGGETVHLHGQQTGPGKEECHHGDLVQLSLAQLAKQGHRPFHQNRRQCIMPTTALLLSTGFLKTGDIFSATVSCWMRLVDWVRPNATRLNGIRIASSHILHGEARMGTE